MIFLKKIVIIFILQMITLQNLYFHVCYEEIYWHKKFQKLSIKTLVTIASPKYRKYHKVGSGPYGL